MLLGSGKEDIEAWKRNIWEPKLFGISQQVRVVLEGMVSSRIPTVWCEIGLLEFHAMDRTPAPPCKERRTSQLGAVERQEAWRFLQGESPCWVRSNQPPIPSVAVVEEVKEPNKTAEAYTGNHIGRKGDRNP